MTSPTSRPPGGSSRRLRLGAIAALSIIVLIGLGVGAFWWRAHQAEAAVAREAREAVERGRFDLAVEAADRWLALRPDAAEAFAVKGRALVGLERPREAFPALETARDLGWPAEKLSGPVGIIFARGGEPAKAEPLLLEARGLSDQPDPHIERALAAVYRSTRRYREALEALDRWIRVEPDDPMPYRWRADIDTLAGAEPVRLAEDFRQIVRLDPDNEPARLALAESLRAAGDAKGASEQFRAYLTEHPESAVALSGAGLSELDLGHQDEAARLLDRALAMQPDNALALDGRARIDLARGLAGEALGRLEVAVVTAPDDPDIHAHRAEALDALGRAEDAAAEKEAAQRLRRDADEIAEIRRGLVARPDDADLQSRAARWLLAHGQEEEGMAWARRALARPGGHPPTAALLAEYFEARGDSAQANYYRLQAGK